MARQAQRAAVFDVNVLVGAVAGGNSPFRSWPSPPPVSDNPYADCVGIVNDAREFALWISSHILTNVVRVLTEPEAGFDWDFKMAEEYVAVLVEIADASTGGVIEPTVRVSDCPDFEDNRILELAAEVGADVIVSEDHHLTDLSPWNGIPVLRPREFAGRIDAARRAARARRDRPLRGNR